MRHATKTGSARKECKYFSARAAALILRHCKAQVYGLCTQNKKETTCAENVTHRVACNACKSSAWWFRVGQSYFDTHETLLHVKLMRTPTDRSWARFCTTFEGLPAAAALSVHGLNHTLRQGGWFWVGDTHICMQPKFLTHKKLLLFHQVPVQSVH